MAYNRFTRVIPGILIVVIIVVALVALISLGRALFFSGSDTTAIPDVSREALLSTTASHSVRMIVRGPIVSNENFRSYQITISPDSRVITSYSGYLDTKLEEVVLSNNVKAYDEFVHALDKANLTKGDMLTGEDNDLRGVCATGTVTDFAVLDNGSAVKELWTSTCKGSRGSLDASASQLGGLFRAQIPESNNLIKKIDL